LPAVQKGFCSGSNDGMLEKMQNQEMTETYHLRLYERFQGLAG
jgi:hypothetical protein